MQPIACNDLIIASAAEGGRMAPSSMTREEAGCALWDMAGSEAAAGLLVGSCQIIEVGALGGGGGVP